MNTNSHSEAKPSPDAWLMLALLALSYAVALVDRVVLSMLVDPIRRDLAISNSEVGLLQGLAFGLVYSFLGVPLGVMTDRYNRIRILVGGLVLWSAANIACGFAQSFAAMFAARMVVGIGEAALAPVAASLICDLFAPHQRSKAYGIYVAGNTVGSIAALSLVGVLLDIFTRIIAQHPESLGGMSPWRLVFVATGLPGLAIAAIVLLLGREPTRTTKEAATQQSPGAGVRTNLAAYAAIMFGGTFVIGGAYAMLNWFPTILMRVHGWNPTAVGTAFGVSTMGLGVLSGLSSGWVIAWLYKRNREDAPMLTGMVAAMTYVVFGFTGCLSSTAEIALGAMMLIACFSNWTMPSVLTALSKVAPPTQLGKVVAIYTLMTGIISLTLGSYVPGVLSDKVFTAENGITRALGVVFLVCGTGGVACFAAARKFAVRGDHGSGAT